MIIKYLIYKEGYMSNKVKGIIFSFLSAFLYDLNVPISKYCLNNLSSNQLLFLLYFGASIGMFLVILFNKNRKSSLILDKKIRCQVLGVVLCDIFASLFIVESLKYLSASVVSLLSVLEIGATILISAVLFKKKISKKLLLSLISVTIGGMLLSIDSLFKDKVSLMVLFVVVATILWGAENNLTASVSDKNSKALVFYKCLSVAIFNLIFILDCNILSLVLNNWYLLLIGFFTYGLSILFFAYGTKFIGAGRTAIIFSLSPIFSMIISIIVFKSEINLLFIISLIFMIIGIYLTASDKSED